LEFLLFRPDRCEATPSIRCVYCISDSSTLLADGRKKKKSKLSGYHDRHRLLRVQHPSHFHKGRAKFWYA
jgi:hypothetical protein